MFCKLEVRAGPRHKQTTSHPLPTPSEGSSGCLNYNSDDKICMEALLMGVMSLTGRDPSSIFCLRPNKTSGQAC